MNFITIESHFWVPDNLIRPHTRNACNKDLVEIIYQITKIIYQNETFEIFLLPSEPWSYKDIIKIINKNAWIISIIAVIIPWIALYDSHQDHNHNEKMRIVDDTAKCLDLQEKILKLWETYDISWINNEKIQEACGNISLKKLKNNRYETLKNDAMISDEETIIKNDWNDILFQKKIVRQDFDKMIEQVPEKEDYLWQDMQWFIELISLVIKQKKAWKWIARRWTYFWENIIYWWIDILTKWEEINFYMQDKEFKKKIDDHSISFASWDNIKIVFDIKCEIKNWIPQNKLIYVKEVQSFNETIIEHVVKNKNIQLDWTNSLFSQTDFWL